MRVGGGFKGGNSQLSGVSLSKFSLSTRRRRVKLELQPRLFDGGDYGGGRHPAAAGCM